MKQVAYSLLVAFVAFELFLFKVPICFQNNFEGPINHRHDWPSSVELLFSLRFFSLQRGLSFISVIRLVAKQIFLFSSLPLFSSYCSMFMLVFT